MASKETFTLNPVAPFDFDLTCQIFGSGDPQIRSYHKGVFRQLLRLGEVLVLASVTSTGTVEHPNLSVEIHLGKALSAKNKADAEQALTYLFNLNFPLTSFYKQIHGDSNITKIAQQLYGLKNPTTPTVFEALVDSIVEQQISIKVAHTLEERLCKKFGDKLQINGQTYYAYPSPQNIRAACISDIRECGLSQRKAEYIYGAAELIVEGKLDLEAMKNQQDPQAIIAELDEIKGIGVWTAELTMLRGMQRLDALPADDFGIRRVISTYYCGGVPIKAAEARAIAEAWGKWKGLAAFYLITAEVKGIVV
jgi:DNA-3-methyladenine glycosylase II